MNIQVVQSLAGPNRPVVPAFAHNPIAAPLPPSALLAMSDDLIRSLCASNSQATSIALRHIAEDAEWRGAWWDYHTVVIGAVCDVATQAEQKTSARRALIRETDVFVSESLLFSTAYSDDEKAVIIETRKEDNTDEQYVERAYASKIFSELSVMCLVSIAEQMGDLSDHDWFDLYIDVAEFACHADMLYLLETADDRKELMGLKQKFADLARRDARRAIEAGARFDYRGNVASVLANNPDYFRDYLDVVAQKD